MKRLLLLGWLLAALLPMSAQSEADGYMLNVNMKNGEKKQFSLDSDKGLSWGIETVNDPQTSTDEHWGQLKVYNGEQIKTDDIDYVTFDWIGTETAKPANYLMKITDLSKPDELGAVDRSATYKYYKIEDIEKITFEARSQGEDSLVLGLNVSTKDGNISTYYSYYYDNYYVGSLCFWDGNEDDLKKHQYDSFNRKIVYNSGYTTDFSGVKNVYRYIITIDSYPHGVYGIVLPRTQGDNWFTSTLTKVCLGSSSGLSVENCDMIGDFYGDECWIGDYYNKLRPRWYSLEHGIRMELEYGKTYYYRYFIKIPIEGHGDAVFYGPEYSFHIPKVMDDAGYYPEPMLTDVAISAAFPEPLKAPSKERIDSWWKEWRATEGGQKTDLSADVTTAEFDDGTGYRVNRLPDEFYVWLASREIVLNLLEGEASSTTTPTLVSDVPSVWDLPRNSYVQFECQNNSVNAQVNWYPELIPGVPYKFQITFAPETQLENNDENVLAFLPTRVRIYLPDGKGSNNRLTNEDFEIPATEVATFSADSVATQYFVPAHKDRMYVSVRSVVKNSEVRNKRFNRIIRIADIRFTPMTDPNTIGIVELSKVRNKRETKPAAWYSLDGRRLQGEPSKPGLYILNGKKLMKK